MRKVNINDTVSVMLTAHGEAQWAAYWNQHSDHGGEVPTTIQSAQRKDGRVEFQLYELMFIFGPACYLGSNRLPFFKNAVYLDA